MSFWVGGLVARTKAYSSTSGVCWASAQGDARKFVAYSCCFYLVSGEEQRSLGRVVGGSKIIVVDGLPPGPHQLVESRGGRDNSWDIVLVPGSQSFDLRSGEMR